MTNPWEREWLGKPPPYAYIAVRLDTGHVVDVAFADVIEALGLNFNRGNALKYVWRAGRKTPDPLFDLRKARLFIDREIARIEDENRRFPHIGPDDDDVTPAIAATPPPARREGA